MGGILNDILSFTRRAAGADGPRSSQPKRRTFTAAYKMAIVEKYDAATEPGWEV